MKSRMILPAIILALLAGTFLFPGLFGRSTVIAPPVDTVIAAETNDPVSKYNQALSAKKPMLVDYSSPGCGACDELEPVIKELEKEYGKKVVFIKFDGSTREQLDLYRKAKVRFVPTLQYIDKEGTVVKQTTGVQPKDEIKSQLESLVK